MAPAGHELPLIPPLLEKLDPLWGVSVTDDEGRILYANDRHCQLCGLRGGQAVGAIHRLAREGVQSAQSVEEVLSTLRRGHIWQEELADHGPGGETRWLGVIALPLRREAGQAVRFVWIIVDITRRKHVEASGGDDDALRALGMWASAISHEIRSPLAGVRGAVEILIGRLPEADHAIGAMILERIDGVDDFLGDLVELARPPEARPGPCQVRPLLERVASQCRDDPRLIRVRFEVVGPSDIVALADIEQLRRALYAIAANAARFGGPGSTVRLSAAEQDGRCRIDVDEEGRSLPRDVGGEDAEPWIVAHGHGLDLALARRLLRSVGGDLTLEEAPSGGPRLTVRLSRMSAS